jgi:hypothetical protein
MNNLWVFSEKEVQATPSAQDGLTVETEYITRWRACKYLERCGVKLIVNHSLLQIGKVILHRFYMLNSLKLFEYHEIAAACLFACCKLGSGKDFIKIEQIVIVCGTEAKKSPISIDSNVYFLI